MTFDANGGTGGWSKRLDAGTPITPPYVTKAYYTLSGWSPEAPAVMPENDVTCVAQWTPKRSPLIFNANGGYGTMPTGLVATYGQAMPGYTQSKPTKTGYSFVGYFDTPSSTGGTQYYTSSLGSATSWNKDTTTSTCFGQTGHAKDIKQTKFAGFPRRILTPPPVNRRESY